jgi:hypothetical protein
LPTPITVLLEGGTSAAVPDGIARLGDAALRGQALETWEAARFLAHAIDLWGIWLLKATPEIEIHVGHAFYQQNLARQAVEVLCAHGVIPPSFRGRATEEILGWFPAVPCGPIRREKDADFIRSVRAAMPRLRDLQGELGALIEQVAAAPLSLLTPRNVDRWYEAPSAPPPAVVTPPQAPGAADDRPEEPPVDCTVKNARIWLKGKPYRLTQGLRALLSYLLGNPGVSEEQVIREFGLSNASHLHKRLKDLRNKLAVELKKSGWRLSIKTAETCISCKWEEAK